MMDDMTLDELTRVCGFYSCESIVNNYYNCSHPECGETEYDPDLKKEVGKCIHFYCPLAYDLEEEDFMGYSGDHRMRLIQSSVTKVKKDE